MFFTKCAYHGEKTNGRMEGKGKFTFANGNHYVGDFMDGMFHGEGTVYFTPENGGGKYKAQWHEVRANPFLCAGCNVIRPPHPLCLAGT